jgi:hypothetical protein
MPGHGTPWGKGISEDVIWYVVRRCAQRMQLEHLAPHDLRRTCAKLCHVNAGELEQIQFLLGHISVLTTERYLGCKQNLEEPVNDRFGCLFSRLSMDLRQRLISPIDLKLVCTRTIAILPRRLLVLTPLKCCAELSSGRA